MAFSFREKDGRCHHWDPVIDKDTPKIGSMDLCERCNEFVYFVQADIKNLRDECYNHKVNAPIPSEFLSKFMYKFDCMDLFKHEKNIHNVAATMRYIHLSLLRESLMKMIILNPQAKYASSISIQDIYTFAPQIKLSTDDIIFYVAYADIYSTTASAYVIVNNAAKWTIMMPALSVDYILTPDSYFWNNLASALAVYKHKIYTLSLTYVDIRKISHTSSCFVMILLLVMCNTYITVEQIEKIAPLLLVRSIIDIFLYYTYKRLETPECRDSLLNGMKMYEICGTTKRYYDIKMKEFIEKLRIATKIAVNRIPELKTNYVIVQDRIQKILNYSGNSKTPDTINELIQMRITTDFIDNAMRKMPGDDVIDLVGLEKILISIYNVQRDMIHKAAYNSFCLTQ